MRRTFIFIAIALVSTLFACTPKRTVNRISPDQQIDLSGRWNDTDSKLAAEELTKEVLGEPWIEDFMKKSKGERPVVVVGLVKNKSHEHIDAETFIKDIEKSIIKSKQVRLVQAGDKRAELRAERADQQENASLETAKKWGLEIGADYIMQGSINSIVDTYENKKVVYYQIDLELTHLQTNEVVWMGDKKIKKFVED